MRADDNVDRAGRESFERHLLFLLRAKAADHLHPDRKAGEPFRQRPQVLKREDGRGREERDLLPIDDGFEGRFADALPGFFDETLLVLRLGAFDVVGREGGFLVAARLETFCFGGPWRSAVGR